MEPVNLQVGDTVTIHREGEWHQHTGQITAIAQSMFTDLRLHEIHPATDLFYADELTRKDNP